MGDDDEEWGEAVQEVEGPRGTDASVRVVQGLVDGEREEHSGMDVDGRSPGEFWTKMKMKRRRCAGLWSSPTSTTLYLPGKKYLLLHRHQDLPPQLSNPLHGRVRRTSSLLLFLRKCRRRLRPRRRSWSWSFLPLSPVASSPDKSPLTSAPASPVTPAQVKSAEEEVLAKSNSGPTFKKKTSTRTHEEK